MKTPVKAKITTWIARVVGLLGSILLLLLFTGHLFQHLTGNKDLETMPLVYLIPTLSLILIASTGYVISYFNGKKGVLVMIIVSLVLWIFSAAVAIREGNISAGIFGGLIFVLPYLITSFLLLLSKAFDTVTNS